MPSTSISQPALRSTSASRHQGTVQPRPAPSPAAQARSVQPGPGALAERRAQLEARWRDRLELVTALSLAYHDEMQYGREEARGGAGVRANRPSSAAVLAPGRRASSRRARLLARQAVTERQALAEIEAALDRITAGRYGGCEQCGMPIAAALLNVQPQSRYCAACARRAAQRVACSC